MDWQAWLLLASLSFLWGGAFFLAKITVTVLPPLTVVWARVAIAALTLLLALRLTGMALPAGLPVWRRFAVLGLVNNIVPFSLLFWGQTQIASGLAAILNAATPISTILVAHWLTRDEHLSLNKLAGIGLGLAGVVLMVGLDALAGIDKAVLAQVACLGATVSYALAAVYARGFRPLGLTPLQIAFGQVTASTVLLLPVMLVADRPWLLANPSPSLWLAVLALGVLCTALAYVMFFSLIARAGATNTALVTMLVPLSALLLGMALLGERLEAQQFAGMALLLAGLAIIDGRLMARLGSRFQAQ
jgi:drug/metabolite transporter (DMT)-like permease